MNMKFFLTCLVLLTACHFETPTQRMVREIDTHLTGIEDTLGLIEMETVRFEVFIEQREQHKQELLEVLQTRKLPACTVVPGPYHWREFNRYRVGSTGGNDDRRAGKGPSEATSRKPRL